MSTNRICRLNRSLKAISLGTAMVGLLTWPLMSAQAQDSLPWQKPWDNAAPAAKQSRPMAPAAAPSRLGADDPDAQSPYGAGGSNGYGNGSSYGTSRAGGNGGYGNSGNSGSADGDAPAPYSTSQGYGSSPSYGSSGPGYSPPPQQGGYNPPPQQGQGYGSPSGPSGYGAPQGRGNDAYQSPRSSGGNSTDSYGAPYGAPQAYEQEPGYPAYGERSTRPEPRYEQAQPRYDEAPTPGRGGGGGYYSQNEISQAGHGFFGSVTRGLASAIEYTFKKAGRPNGYVLGEDGGGAFIAGLRYGEGTLFTKDAGQHKIYWQGPSLGYDVGAEGSKTMVLVYNMRDVQDLFNRFGGVEGSAYLVGGVSVQFQKYGDVSLALIRSGVGLRLGANVGYLKYSRKPTWNPF
jgi:hypothetical protein